MRDAYYFLRQKKFAIMMLLQNGSFYHKENIMDHELWCQLSHAMFDVARSFPKLPRQTYDTHRIVRLYLWATLHDRPVVWTCDPRNWPRQTRPTAVPNQSTMSRRLRDQQTWRFLERLARRVAGPVQPTLIKILDGKPLVVAKHSADADATMGRGIGGLAKGYKLHAIWGIRPMPLAWSVHPLNVSEVTEARTLIPQLTGEGYLLADANYDRNVLYDQAAACGHQLIAQRQSPGAGLGHIQHSPHRLRSIHLLEWSPSPFGRELYRRRRDIERDFAGLVGFGGGLQCLPSWVRTLGRVRLFVHAKLIINAARIRRRAA